MAMTFFHDCSDVSSGSVHCKRLIQILRKPVYGLRDYETDVCINVQTDTHHHDMIRPCQLAYENELFHLSSLEHKDKVDKKEKKKKKHIWSDQRSLNYPSYQDLHFFSGS